MRIFTTVIATLLPVLLRAQGIVIAPAPPLAVDPADPSSMGVSISPGLGDTPSYGIDLNGDGVVDFTLTSVYQDQSFYIIPAGSNAVLSYVIDSFGSSYVANLGAGTVVGPSNSLSPVWQQTVVIPPVTLNGHTYPASYVYPNITAAYADGIQGEFANASGFVGLEFYDNNQTYYGFLQIDCRAYGGYGGFYEGFGYNSVPGQPITIIAVPEPSSAALLCISAAALWAKRRR